MALLARLFAAVNGISCQVEENFSALGATLDSPRSTIAADELGQMMILRLNKIIIPEIRAYEKELAKINIDARA